MSMARGADSVFYGARSRFGPRVTMSTGNAPGPPSLDRGRYGRACAQALVPFSTRPAATCTRRPSTASG